MGDSYPKIRLGDHAAKIGSGATPRGGQKVYQSFGVALIRSQNVYNNVFSYDGLAFISNEHARELNNVTVEPGDILLNITGDSVARVCQVPDDVLPARVNQHVAIIRPDCNVLDAKYLRYYLVSQYMQAYMLSLAGSGGTRNALTKGMIEDFQIPAPRIEEQRSIAEVLSTLDDEIKLNRQMNQTLEGIARAIFKSWFVDFDPVWAKMDGEQPYGMDAETAALFPDAFTDSSLGLIPKGWQVRTLGDLCEVAIGGDWGKPESFEGAIEVVCLRGVDLEHLRASGWADAPKRWVKRSSLSKRQMSDCDVLIASSGVGPCGRPLWSGPDLEKVFSVPIMYSNFCKRFRTTSPEYAVYVDRVLLNIRESNEVWEYANGTSIPNLDHKGLLSGYQLVVPPFELLRRFYAFVTPIYDKLYSPESRTLAELRDTLLPKLISGQLRVPDAETLIRGTTKHA